MCRVLEVSRSGLYAWRRRRPAARVRRDAELRAKIKLIHTASRGTYGSPRVRAQLRHVDERVGKGRVERLMREESLRGKVRRRFKRTTDSEHVLPIAPNTLDRRFTADAPDRVWAADITYLPLVSGGVSYLAVVVDLYSRRVVGWAMAEHLRTELVLDALDVALSSREPASDLLHHSDRGCQYTSTEYRDALRQLAITVSMSRKGNCWDNAVAESFFATLKTELVYRRRWRNRIELRTAVFEYIEVFYNRRRLHSSLDYQTPAEVDESYAEAA